MYDSIVIEGKNRPTATFVFEHFLNDALSAASSKGVPVIRAVPETVVSESTVIEDIEAARKGMLSPIITEMETGQARVQQLFKVSRLGTIAGCMVEQGEMRANSNADSNMPRGVSP